MNLNESIGYLQKLFISPRLYFVQSLGNGQCICITKKYGNDEAWAVFYSERGQRVGIEYFQAEKEAYDKFIKNIVKNYLHQLEHGLKNQLRLYQVIDHFITYNIPPSLYTIGSLGGGNCMCLTENYEQDHDWAVFYSQHNKRLHIKHFDHADEAVNNFIQRVIQLRITALKTAELNRQTNPKQKHY